MGKLLVTGPTVEPITYADFIYHDRMDLYDESIDEASILYIEGLILAVRMDVEKYLNRALITQTWKYYLDDFPDEYFIELPMPPLRSVESVKYTDSGGTVTPMVDGTDYLVDTISLKGRILLPYSKSWPSIIPYPMNAVEIEFICGYGDPENIPQPIKNAMLLQIASLYDNRESVVAGQPIHKTDTAELLLWPYRVFGF